MIQHQIVITATIHDNGFVDLGVTSQLPAPNIEMYLAEVLAVVRREMQAIRLGQPQQQVVLARPNGLPGAPI